MMAYSLIIRPLIIVLILILLIVAFIVLMKSNKPVKFKALISVCLVISAVATVFFMFFYGIYSKPATINDKDMEELCTKCNSLNFTYDSEWSEASENDVYTVEFGDDEGFIRFEKMQSDEDIDIRNFHTNNSNNGFDFVYKNLEQYSDKSDIEWYVAPLCAERVAESLWAFSGGYTGVAVIKNQMEYISIVYTIKTTDSPLAFLGCVPPDDFDLINFIDNMI